MTETSNSARHGVLSADGRFRLADLRARPYSGPLKRPFVTSRRRVDSVQGVLVEAEFDNGTRGVGTAAETWAVTGESVASILATINGPIFDALTGRDLCLREAADAVATCCQANTSAKAAVDVALHDAWASGLGLPLATALGGNTSGTLETDMTVSLADPERMAREAVAAWADGFEILKIKLGQDWQQDVNRLETIREAVPRARFRLDANQGWNAKEAISAIRRLEDAGLPIDLVEQPTPKHDLIGLARVTAAVDTLIMADESVATPRDALEIIRRGAADLLNIKLAKCGGIGPALAIAHLAEAAEMGCMIGAMMEPRPSIAAAMHLTMAHPAITIVDLDSAEWIKDSRISGGYARDGAHLRLSDRPGLGIDLDDSLTEGSFA